MRIIKEIQNLRGIAVLMVLLGHVNWIGSAIGVTLGRLHLTWLSNAPGLSSYFVAIADVGVDVFFVISGYVVTSSLMHSLKVNQPAGFITNLENNVATLKAFFVRRFFRLAPVAILLILCQTPCIWLFPTWFSGTNITEQFMGFLSYIGMQSDIDTITFSLVGQHFRMMNHFWSLAVEERFYLIIPFVILYFANVRTFLKVAVLTIVGLTILKALYPFNSINMHLNGFLRFDSFMFGIIVYIIQSNTNIFNQLFTRKYSVPIMNSVSFLLVVMLARLPISEVNGETVIHYTQFYFYYLSVYSLSTILIMFAIQEKGYVFGLPYLGAILGWIGDRSYTIYVFQFFYMFLVYKVADLIHVRGDSYVEMTLLFFIVGGLITEGIYRFYENRWRKKGKEIAQRIINEASSSGQATPIPQVSPIYQGTGNIAEIQAS